MILPVTACPCSCFRQFVAFQNQICRFAQRVPNYKHGSRKEHAYRDEYFSYIVFVKAEGSDDPFPYARESQSEAKDGTPTYNIEDANSYARIINAPTKHKGAAFVDLCTPSGKLSRAQIKKAKYPALFNVARKATWGGLWPTSYKQYKGLMKPEFNSLEKLYEDMGYDEEEIKELLSIAEEATENAVDVDLEDTAGALPEGMEGLAQSHDEIFDMVEKVTGRKSVLRKMMAPTLSRKKGSKPSEQEPEPEGEVHAGESSDATAAGTGAAGGGSGGRRRGGRARGAASRSRARAVLRRLGVENGEGGGVDEDGEKA